MQVPQVVPSQVGYPQATQIIYPQMQIASASGSLGTVPQQAPGVLQMDQSSVQPNSLLNHQAASQGFHLLQPQSQLLPMTTNNTQQALQAQQVSAQQALLSGQLSNAGQSQMNAQFSVFPQQTQFLQQGQLQGQTTGVPGLSGALMPSYSGQTALLSQNYPLMQLGHSAADSSAMSSNQIQAFGGLSASQMLTVGQLANPASAQSAMSFAQLQQLKSPQQASTQLLFSTNQSAGSMFASPPSQQLSTVQQLPTGQQLGFGAMTMPGMQLMDPSLLGIPQMALAAQSSQPQSQSTSHSGGPSRGTNVDPTAICEDTIFISGLGADVTHDALSAFFGSIGVIKVNRKTNKPMIWIFRDAKTRRPNGTATVTYDDVSVARTAVAMFNGRAFGSGALLVQLATYGQKPNYQMQQQQQRSAGNPNAAQASGGGFGLQNGAPGGASGGRDRERQNDWICGQCSNLNYGWRTACNRCHVEKEAANATLVQPGMARLLPNSVRTSAAAMGRGGGGAGGQAGSATGGYQARPSLASTFGGSVSGSAASSARGAPGPDRNIANRQKENRQRPY